MRGRDALREMLEKPKAKEPTTEPSPPVRVAGAVKAVSLGLQHLSNEAAAAKSLRASLARTEQVVELQVDEIDVSFVADRIPIESDPAFQSLKEKIEAHGQQVPILVRPHPNDPSRYQAAYGHRRLSVARDLQRPVRAIVRKLTDDELVIAQGQENSERKNLSFIERALYASELLKRGFDRTTIGAALGVDMPELSRLFGVVVAFDARIVLAIGPAPKVGRPRWLALAAKMTTTGASKIVESAISSEVFSKRDSNARFDAVQAAFEGRSSVESEVRLPLNTRSGKRIGWLETTAKGARLVSTEITFAAFLARRVSLLLQEFEEEETLVSSDRKVGAN